MYIRKITNNFFNYKNHKNILAAGFLEGEIKIKYTIEIMFFSCKLMFLQLHKNRKQHFICNHPLFGSFSLIGEEN